MLAVCGKFFVAGAIDSTLLLCHPPDYRTNADLIEHAAKLWRKDQDVVADLTYGKGVFWRKTNGRFRVGSDLIAKADVRADFRQLPEYERRKRAERRAAAAPGGAPRCAECAGLLPAGVGPATRFCSKDCRRASTDRKLRRRLASPSRAETWPEPVPALTARLHRLELERRIAPPEQRGAPAATIRAVTGEIEAAKRAAMEAEAA